MQTQQQIWDWYKTFSHNNNLYDDDRPNNCFIKNDLSVVPTELQLKVPAPYGQFLEEIGHGWLREDATGRVTNSRDNAFLSFDEISLIINKQSPEWDIYEDLIEENEIPFFSPNANSFFVFAPDGGVYYPYRVRKFADDLHQFLAKLMNDVTFYAEKG